MIKIAMQIRDLTHGILRVLDYEKFQRKDTGDTLIEVLITLAVLGITAASLLLAFSTSISASAQHRNLAVSDTVLRSATETIFSDIQSKAVPLSCSVKAAQYQSLITAQGTALVPVIWSSSYQVAITNVAYWNGSKFSSMNTCTTGYPQQFTVQVKGLGGTWNDYPVVGGSSLTQILPNSLSTQSIVAAVSATSSLTSNSVTVSLANPVPPGSGTISFFLDQGNNQQLISSTACSLSSTNGSPPTATLSGSASGTCYVYASIGADSVYQAAQSSDVTVTFSAPTPTTLPTVSAPTNVSATANNSSSITIKFTNSSPPTGVASYTCTVYSNSGLTMVAATNTSCIGSGTTVSNLSSKTTYWVTITAIGQSGYQSSNPVPTSGLSVTTK